MDNILLRTLVLVRLLYKRDTLSWTNTNDKVKQAQNLTFEIFFLSKCLFMSLLRLGKYFTVQNLFLMEVFILSVIANYVLIIVNNVVVIKMKFNMRFKMRFNKKGTW